MDSHPQSSLLATPLCPPEQTPKWIHKMLTDPRAGSVLEQIGSLTEARLMGVMIIKEFLGHRITPLQAHSRPFWEFATGGEPMCVHVSGLMHDELD
ncbi:hypothetical protein D1007_20809 [Hordeum vulgare]|nr:hypothetical protein D1007_20809 [Hordeum vulgare]